MTHTCLDTGMCAQESLETLMLQQYQLVHGKRSVLMFPTGTLELPLLDGFVRYENNRGVFHVNPEMIDVAIVEFFSLQGRENLFLNLGPFSKDEIAERALKGEKVTCISEVTFNGTEIRTAAATDGTLAEQYAYFESTKEPDGIILVGVLPDRIRTAKQKVK